MSSAEPRPITRASFERQLRALQSPDVDPAAGFFGPASPMWQMGRQTLSLVGAGRATLLQLAHPWVAHAIDQHSLTRSDPTRRLRATFRFVLTMGFGSVEQALQAAHTVHRIHSRVRGELPASPAGGHYCANEVDAMAWVHATLVETTVYMHELVLGPLDEDLKADYYQASKRFAQLFGIPPEALPRDWPAFMAYNRRMWDSPELAVGDTARELAGFLFGIYPLVRPLMRRYRLFTACIMPPPLRTAFGLPEASGANRRRFERWLWWLRAAWPHLPQRLRYLPTYFEAQRRLQGRNGPDLLAALGNRWLLGCYRVVS